MSLEGHVDILLPRDPSGVVKVDLKEPADVTGLLTGRTPEDVIRLIPALYSLCGTAHASAAAEALEAAAGRGADPVTRRHRAALVLMERAREHILRIALDWPRHLGEDDDVETAQAALPLLSGFRAALDPTESLFLENMAGPTSAEDALVSVAAAKTLAEQKVFGESLEDWGHRRDLPSIKAWATHGKTSAARFIAMLLTGERAGLGAVSTTYLSDAAADTLEPDVSEAPIPETSSLERCKAYGFLNREKPDLATRYLARLVDLTDTFAELSGLLTGSTDLTASANRPDLNGLGIAETARGRLAHVVTLKEGLVDKYRIVSPTRWNFAENGIAVRCLGSMRDGTDAARVEQAELVIGAIDPCVAHHVRIT